MLFFPDLQERMCLHPLPALLQSCPLLSTPAFGEQDKRGLCPQQASSPGGRHVIEIHARQTDGWIDGWTCYVQPQDVCAPDPTWVEHSHQECYIN